MNGSTKKVPEWLIGTKFIFNKTKCNLISTNNLVVPSSTIIAKGDIGTSHHCFALNTQNFLINVNPVPGPNITLPSQQTIQAVVTTNISIKNFQTGNYNILTQRPERYKSNFVGIIMWWQLTHTTYKEKNYTSAKTKKSCYKTTVTIQMVYGTLPYLRKCQ